MTRNELKNFCDFIDNRQWQAETIIESGLTETKRLASEHLYNLMLDADVRKELADSISDTLADKYVIQQKELKDLNYNFDGRMLTTTVTFDDGSKVYIFVQSGMIFVADCNYKELCERIDNDDIDSYEAYDTTDGCDYYMRSEYSEFINCSLLQIANRFL